LDFLVNHDTIRDGVFGETIEMFFVSHGFQLIHELLVENFVEVGLEEGDNAIDVSILFLQFLVVTTTLQRISCGNKVRHFFIEFV